MANSNLGQGGQLPRIGVPAVPAGADAQQQQQQQVQQQQQHPHHQQHQQLSAAAAAAAVGAAQQAAVAAIYRQEASTRAAAAVAANENAILGSLNHHHHQQQHHHGNWLGPQATAAAAAMARHQHQQHQSAQATVAKAQAFARAQEVAVAKAAAAQEAANKNPQASNQPHEERDPDGIGHMDVIPIGFFRDPQGNAWAASLQHPSHASRRRSPQDAEDNPLSAASIAAARFAALRQFTELHQQNEQQQQQRVKQNTARKQQSEVIDLQSDEDEEEEQTKRPALATKPDQGQGAPKVPPAQNPPLSMQQNSKEHQMKVHVQEQRNANLDRRPGASMPSARVAAALRDGSITQILQAPTESQFLPPPKKPLFGQPAVVKRPAPPSLPGPVDPTKFRQLNLEQAHVRAPENLPQAKRRKSDTGSTRGDANANTAHRNNDRTLPTTPETPSPEEMRERHKHALRQVILSDRTSNLVSHYGPFVHKWLGAGPTEPEKVSAVKACVDTILMTATGYTHETVPPSLPFPPAEINLDMRQLEELAQELVAEKNSAIGEAVRSAFTEMKASHDDAVVNRKRSADEAKIFYRETVTLKAKHKQELNDIRVENDKTVEALHRRIKELQEQLQAAKEESGASTMAQTKSLETMMKASVLSLRMIRRSQRTMDQ